MNRCVSSWLRIGLLVGATLGCSWSEAAVFYVDFGNSSYPSAASTYVDANGNTWNNAINANAGATLSNLSNTDGGASSISLFNAEQFAANGGPAYGLPAPNATYLGEFAIASATLDNWYTFRPNDATGRDLYLNGLDATRTYNLSFFAVRQNTEVRSTTYTVTGGNGVFSANLQTSGTGMGLGGFNGNNTNIIRLLNIAPDVNNRITINVNALVGDFGYINILGIEEVVPEPSTAMFLMIGGALIHYARRRHRSEAA